MKKTVSYQSIQLELRKFSKRWKNYSLNERTGAQTFLNEFFDSFGIIFDPDKLPYEFNTGDGFADCYIKGKVILEMKDGNKVKTKADLTKAIPQAMKYWKAKGKEVNFLILSNFKSFLIIDTRDLSSAYIKLSELEKRISSFSFLFGSSAILLKEQEAVSRNATELMGKLYLSLKSRLRQNKSEEIDLFVAQCVFCMFAEDVGFLPNGIFTGLVNRSSEGVFNSAHLLSSLFKMMDEKDNIKKQGSLFEHVRWFNGPLFKVRPEIVLNDSEIEMLSSACDFDWSQIKPEIFGVLFESSADDDDKHNNGMHFTSESDILKIVKPCIIDYWQSKFQNCETQNDYESLHKELKKYRILDPACGSGNFLLVAYREIKRFESQIFHKLVTITGKDYKWIQNHMGYFPVQNMYGIEIKSFPTLLAKVSLWIAKKSMQVELYLDEPDLPLESLTHIINTDALQTKWDDVDVVIGNPPFIGCKQIRNCRGDNYFDWLSSRFKDHNKMSDYCTYWYEKVLEDIRSGVRVGFVSTNSISQNTSRIASLDKVVKAGGELFDVWKDVKWSGDANVTVSLVCFTNKSKITNISKKIANKSVMNINTRLESDTDIFDYPKVTMNKRSFVGVAIQGVGFTLTTEEKSKILKKSPKEKLVIKKFLSGQDLNQNVLGVPSRWIVDFGDMELQDASAYTESIEHVRKKVKPHRDKVRRKAHKKFWWHYGDKRMEMREKTKKLKKMLVISNVSKHVFFQFISSKILPSHSCTVIASEDYFTFAVLNSVFHEVWAWHTCSTMRLDIRYSGTKCFDTFPFPKSNIKEIEALGEKLDKERINIMKSRKIGMTELYNGLNEGSYSTLSKIIEKLNIAIAKGYSFDKSDLLDKEKVLNMLRSLNEYQAEELRIAMLMKQKSEINKKVDKRKKGKKSRSNTKKVI
ncbi:MAG: hypothetical protein CME65_04155 [Halobacteriovoraceae bacterium]|nr:hypothetical protein [Halobacteriovoraceae bacterium]|tara:strand:+ start:17456 stop:20215 length:2760 start_codon:yes stop_codon:yes gene_type:complete